MTAALEGGEWSAARPGRTLPQGKTRYQLYRRLGGPQGRSGRAENLVPTGIRSRTVQTVVSHNTDWATGPTCRVWPNSIFPRYLINGKIFGETPVFEYEMCILIFSSNFVKIISQYNSNSGRHRECTQAFMYSTRYCCCHIAMKREISQQIFEKFSKFKCHKNLSSGIRVGLQGRRTDRQARRN